MALIAPLSMLGQTPTSSSTSEDTKKKDEPIVLEKYTVDTTQDTGYASKNTLSSAGRLSTRLLDTPQVIQIVNHELLQDLGADSMLGAVQMASGGIVRRSFNPGDDQYIWGFRSSSSLKDGISLGLNAVGPMYDVDRVEVLKGPIAMTFGNAGFVGGAINYVTRKPAKKPSTEIVASVASFDYRRGELHMSRPVTSAFRYRLDLGATDSKYSKRRYSYYKDAFLGGGFVYDISTNTRLDFDAAFFKTDFNRALTFIDPSTFKVFAAPDTFSYDTSESRYPTKNFRVTSTLTSTIGPEFGVSLFFGYINANNNWFRPYATGYNPATGILQRVSEDYVTSQHNVVTNLDFSKGLVTGPLHHTIVFGAANTFSEGGAGNHSFETSDLDVHNPGDGGTVSHVTGTGRTVYSDYSNSRSRSSSAYIQDTISILDNRAYVVAGYRWNDSLSDNPNAAAKASAFSKGVNRYGAVYKVTKDIALHYNHSQAYIFNGGVDYRNVPLVPSVGNEEEWGAKAELLDGQLSLTATYFNIELTKVRLLFVEGPNDPQPGNEGIAQGGTQTNKGYELTAAFTRRIGSGEVNLIATMYKGHILNEFKIKPVGATNNTGSFLAKYRVVQGPIQNLSVGAGVNSQGSRLAGKIAQIPNSDWTHLPAYTAYNVFAAYTRGRFRYQLNVDNLTDEKFIEGAELPFWIYTDPGRTIKLTVAYKF